MAVWNADVFPDDQLARITAATSMGGVGAAYIGMVVRHDGLPLASATSYWFFTDGGSDSAIVKIVGGSVTSLNTNNALTVAIGDVLELSVIGTALVASKNGTPVISVTDASIASGSAGVYAFSSIGTGFAKVSDWTGDVA
jgi:hypothetical protein